MSKDEIKDKKRKSEDLEVVSSKKAKKEKKEKKEKSKDKKDKKSKDKKEKKSKKHEESNTTTSRTYNSAESVSQSEIDAFLSENEIKIEDPAAEKNSSVQPALTFASLGSQIDSRIMKTISKFPKPTPIQSVSWPYLINGNDVVGVAETGSGKTFAFGVPAIDHILKSDDKTALRVLAISPTRELATQIYDNLKELTDATGLQCTCVYGGVPKEEQRVQIRRSQCVVATPGRLIDLLDEGSIKLDKIDYLILDEGDRMLEKGFEEDIKKIIGATRPNRQTLMFTATWPKEVRELASSFMNNPIKVTIGNREELTANKRITQIVEVIEQTDKERKLLQLLQKYHSGAKANDKVLIFALYKKEASRIERTLNYKGYKVAALHGDLSQGQRTQALDSFKKGECNLMLATDVAARGLDIPNVKVVINLTFPLTIEDYVHRIGRTGRAGQSGIAHTLFTENEKHLSGALMNVLRGGNQEVPEDLLKFGSHTKKKEHSAYGAFFKNVDMSKKAKKITFD